MSPERSALERAAHRARAIRSMLVPIPPESSRDFARRLARESRDDPRRSISCPPLAPTRRVASAASAREVRSARDVLFASPISPASPRTRVIADRSVSSALATASIVGKFALALEPAGDGINHGTVRNVLDSSRANGKQSTLHAIDRSSRIVVAGHTEPARRSACAVPRTRPSRSDRTSVGCMPREDQGGPQ